MLCHFKAVLLGLATIGMCGSAAAQGSTTPSLILDFGTRDTSLYWPATHRSKSVRAGLGERQEFSVVVKNINLDRYTVQVKVTGADLFRQVPKPFQAMVTPQKDATGGAGGDSTEDAIVDSQQLIKAFQAKATELSKGILKVNTRREADALRDQAMSFLKFMASGQPAKFDKLANPGKDAQGNAIEPSTPNTLAADVASTLRNLVSDGAEAAPDKLTGLFASVVSLSQAATPGPMPAKVQAQKELADPQLADSMAAAVDVFREALTESYLGDKTTGPFSMSGDVTQVEITVTDTSSASAKPEVIDIRVPVNGGWKVDFSGGFLVTSLADFTYGTKDSGITATPYRARVKDGGTNRYTDVFFAHAYPRQVGDYTLALSVGLSVNDSSFIAGGLSLLLGRDQRFVITFGEAAGNVKRLDGPSLLSNPNVPTRDSFMFRPFFGISYNF